MAIHLLLGLQLRDSVVKRVIVAFIKEKYVGAVAFQYKDVFEKNKVQVFSANLNLYGDMSNRIMNILGNYSCEQEIYSIDEFFLKLEGYDFFNLKVDGQ